MPNWRNQTSAQKMFHIIWRMRANKTFHVLIQQGQRQEDLFKCKLCKSFSLAIQLYSPVKTMMDVVDLINSCVNL